LGNQEKKNDDFFLLQEHSSRITHQIVFLKNIGIEKNEDLQKFKHVRGVEAAICQGRGGKGRAGAAPLSV